MVKDKKIYDEKVRVKILTNGFNDLQKGKEYELPSAKADFLINKKLAEKA